MNNQPEKTYTIEEFITYKDSDPYTYHNFSILTRSLVNENFVYSEDNIIYNYIDELKLESVLILLSTEEFIKYQYKPKLLAFDLYGSTELYFIILSINNMCNIKDFNIRKLRILSPNNLSILLNQIYNAESEYIQLNRNKLEIQES